jgi:hypothetical protein
VAVADSGRGARAGSEMSELHPNHVGVEGAVIRLGELSLAMCGGKDLDSYVDEFRAQGESQCTNVWSKGIIAYRCRTCQTNDSRYVWYELALWFPSLLHAVAFWFLRVDRLRKTYRH